jgi:dipeptidyl aminopeptidase/acylaminoacyl peptidase
MNSAFPKTAPYGTWASPLSADMVAGQTVGLSSLSADGGALLWLESRPSESGRSALVRRAADGTISDLTPMPFNVASRVHEYGGGAYVARDGRVVFSHKPDGSVWLIQGDAAPALVASVPGCRYADFRFTRCGRHVICVREDHRGRPPTDPKAAIVALDLSGTEPAVNAGRLLVEGADFLSSPRLSPDGRSLAWLAWDHPDMPWDATRLYVAPLLAPLEEGPRLGEARLLMGGERESLVQPEWSADGILHVCSDRSGWWNLYRVADRIEPICPMEAEIGGPQWVFGQRWFALQPDNSILAVRVRNGLVEPVRLRDGQAVPLPFGQMGDCPVTLPSGVMAYISSPPDAPPAVMLAEPGAEPLSLRASGTGALGKGDISVGVSIAFPTDDGHTGHAFFYPPTNSRFRAPDGERPPLIVISHGGPTGMSTNGFSQRVQWWTSRGLAVVDVNYVGSTGFGRAYRQRLDGQWGVVDVADCIAAVRHLVESNAVDPARIAIRGGSAGGFTTLAALTSSRVFSAGASHYGVADLMLLAADTHKFEARYLDRLIGPLPEAANLYQARSPINHLDRLSAPVIFFQGLDDKVVPPNQARTMAAAMTARDLPVALYEFEGEGHGFRRAETIRRVLELELAFYGQVFGFQPAGLTEKVTFPAASAGR